MVQKYIAKRGDDFIHTLVKGKLDHIKEAATKIRYGTNIILNQFRAYDDKVVKTYDEIIAERYSDDNIPYVTLMEQLRLEGLSDVEIFDLLLASPGTTKFKEWLEEEAEYSETSFKRTPRHDYVRDSIDRLKDEIAALKALQEISSVRAETSLSLDSSDSRLSLNSNFQDDNPSVQSAAASSSQKTVDTAEEAAAALSAKIQEKQIQLIRTSMHHPDLKKQLDERLAFLELPEKLESIQKLKQRIANAKTMTNPDQEAVKQQLLELEKLRLDLTKISQGFEACKIYMKPSGTEVISLDESPSKTLDDALKIIKQELDKLEQSIDALKIFKQELNKLEQSIKNPKEMISGTPVSEEGEENSSSLENRSLDDLVEIYASMIASSAGGETLIKDKRAELSTFLESNYKRIDYSYRQEFMYEGAPAVFSDIVDILGSWDKPFIWKDNREFIEMQDEVDDQIKQLKTIKENFAVLYAAVEPQAAEEASTLQTAKLYQRMYQRIKLPSRANITPEQANDLIKKQKANIQKSKALAIYEYGKAIHALTREEKAYLLPVLASDWGELSSADRELFTEPEQLANYSKCLDLKSVMRDYSAQIDKLAQFPESFDPFNLKPDENLDTKVAKYKEEFEKLQEILDDDIVEDSMKFLNDTIQKLDEEKQVLKLKIAQSSFSHEKITLIQNLVVLQEKIRKLDYLRQGFAGIVFKHEKLAEELKIDDLHEKIERRQTHEQLIAEAEAIYKESEENLNPETPNPKDPELLKQQRQSILAEIDVQMVNKKKTSQGLTMRRFKGGMNIATFFEQIAEKVYLKRSNAHPAIKTLNFVISIPYFLSAVIDNNVKSGPGAISNWMSCAVDVWDYWGVKNDEIGYATSLSGVEHFSDGLANAINFTFFMATLAGYGVLSPVVNYIVGSGGEFIQEALNSTLDIVTQSLDGLNPQIAQAFTWVLDYADDVAMLALQPLMLEMGIQMATPAFIQEMMDEFKSLEDMVDDNDEFAELRAFFKAMGAFQNPDAITPEMLDQFNTEIEGHKDVLKEQYQLFVKRFMERKFKKFINEAIESGRLDSSLKDVIAAVDPTKLKAMREEKLKKINGLINQLKKTHSAEINDDTTYADFMLFIERRKQELTANLKEGEELDEASQKEIIELDELTKYFRKSETTMKKNGQKPTEFYAMKLSEYSQKFNEFALNGLKEIADKYEKNPGTGNWSGLLGITQKLIGLTTQETLNNNTNCEDLKAELSKQIEELNLELKKLSVIPNEDQDREAVSARSSIESKIQEKRMILAYFDDAEDSQTVKNFLENKGMENGAKSEHRVDIDQKRKNQHAALARVMRSNLNKPKLSIAEINQMTEEKIAGKYGLASTQVEGGNIFGNMIPIKWHDRSIREIDPKLSYETFRLDLEARLPDEAEQILGELSTLREMHHRIRNCDISRTKVDGQSVSKLSISEYITHLTTDAEKQVVQAQAVVDELEQKIQKNSEPGDQEKLLKAKGDRDRAENYKADVEFIKEYCENPKILAKFQVSKNTKYSVLLQRMDAASKDWAMVEVHDAFQKLGHPRDAISLQTHLAQLSKKLSDINKKLAILDRKPKQQGDVKDQEELSKEKSQLDAVFHNLPVLKGDASVLSKPLIPMVEKRVENIILSKNEKYSVVRAKIDARIEELEQIRADQHKIQSRIGGLDPADSELEILEKKIAATNEELVDLKEYCQFLDYYKGKIPEEKVNQFTTFGKYLSLVIGQAQAETVTRGASDVDMNEMPNDLKGTLEVHNVAGPSTKQFRNTARQQMKLDDYSSPSDGLGLK